MASIDYPGFSQGAYPVPPRGILLHGTRGGNANRQAEFLGTCRWVTNPANGGLGWAVTIGDGVYAQHLPPREWGYHAREHSVTYIGVEFVQPTVQDEITDDQVTTFAQWYLRDILPAWPHLTKEPLMAAHSEMPAGKRDGKSDPYPVGDPRIDTLIHRLTAAIAAPPANTVDEALEREYQKEAAMLGAKQYKALVTRPRYSGPVLVCERGIVATDPTTTTVARAEATDDWETYLTANNVLQRL